MPLDRITYRVAPRPALKSVSGIWNRILFILLFAAAVAVTIMIVDDGTLLGKPLLFAKGPLADADADASGAAEKEKEQFEVDGEGKTKKKKKDRKCDPSKIPQGLAPPGVLPYSPAHFEDGNKKNLDPGVDARLISAPPDPQRLSLLLQWRKREDLYIACKARRKHQRPPPPADPKVTPVAFDKGVAPEAATYPGTLRDNLSCNSVMT